jgi:hypothetical protein
MSRRHRAFVIPFNTLAPAITQNIHGTTEAHYGEEIWRWQFQNKREVTHYEVSELFGNASSGSANRKIATMGIGATGQHPLNRNIFEDFDFDAATEKHNPCTGDLLSRKESATQVAKICAFSSEVAGSSALKTTSHSTPSTPQST